MAYRIYVGNLPIDIREREIDDLFYKYGRIRDIDLKTPSRPPAFAFVSFEYQDDADAAIRGRDGYDFDGNRLRVEYSKGSRGGERGDRRGDRDRGRGGGRRSEWQVIVTKLPRSASWQDLKDFMRRAGDVIYADVDRNGDGVVEYSNEEDMENAVRKLDDTEFKNPFDKSFVRVRYADERKERRGGSRDCSRSRDRDRRSRSRDSRSPSRSDSRDRKSRKDRSPDSRSPARDRKAASRSRSDSRGRSPHSKERKSVSRSRSPSGDKDRKRSVSGSRE